MTEDYQFTLSVNHIVRALSEIPKEQFKALGVRRRNWGRNSIRRAWEALQPRLGEHLLSYRWHRGLNGELLDVRLRLPYDPGGWHQLRSELSVALAEIVIGI